MSDFHVYEPRHDHGLKHDPLECHRRSQADRLDFFPGHRRYWQPRSVQLLQCLQLHATDHRLCQYRVEDSVRNIEATREFVWNLAPRPLAEVNRPGFFGGSNL
ncbi:hypothetical protein SAMN04244573_03277 [Azotobacter beijerinckii]|uniref:Uncharacterized protein n=1 Tax=Azotobacter beijerinckii TaxID=170623 RepID=A0A1H9MWQ8_9GAMM|nr:hypothetical protein SAMN04244573_03277 [Azotobacter beijerinckii]